MPLLKMVHVGGINVNDSRLCDRFKGSKAELIYELNCELFDYLYANGLPIVQLPPLDDWVRSTEDSTYWSLVYPDSHLTVWIRSEHVEFK